MEIITQQWQHDKPDKHQTRPKGQEKEAPLSFRCPSLALWSKILPPKINQINHDQHIQNNTVFNNHLSIPFP
jgi:hypothetical protein